VFPLPVTHFLPVLRVSPTSDTFSPSTSCFPYQSHIFSQYFVFPLPVTHFLPVLRVSPTSNRFSPSTSCFPYQYQPLNSSHSHLQCIKTSTSDSFLTQNTSFLHCA